MKGTEVSISRIAFNEMVPFSHHRPRSGYRQAKTNTNQQELTRSNNKLASINKKNVFVLNNTEYLNGLTPRKNINKIEEKERPVAKRYSHNQSNVLNKVYNNNYKQFPQRLLVKPRQNQPRLVSKFRKRRHSCQPSSGELVLSKMLYLQFSETRNPEYALAKGVLSEGKKPYMSHRRANSCSGVERTNKREMELSAVGPWDISEQLDISKL